MILTQNPSRLLSAHTHGTAFYSSRLKGLTSLFARLSITEIWPCSRRTSPPAKPSASSLARTSPPRSATPTRVFRLSGVSLSDSNTLADGLKANHPFKEAELAEVHASVGAIEQLVAALASSPSLALQPLRRQPRRRGNGRGAATRARKRHLDARAALEPHRQPRRRFGRRGAGGQ